MPKKNLRDIVVQDKRVLLRVDFNVPQDPQTGAITDDSRLRASLPTINYLFDSRARIVLCSHWGRPQGRVVDSLRIAPIAQRLSQLLGRPVMLAPDSVGPAVEALALALKAGEILFLENLRFHAEEEKNDPVFSLALARLGEVFVNDAFGTTHRAHASTVGVARHLPGVAGFLLEKELRMLGGALNNPARPLAVLTGGAKVSDKMAVLMNILDKVNVLLIGGGMANTFLAAQGYSVGSSAVEVDRLSFAQDILGKAPAQGINLLLPVDVVVAQKLEASARTQIVPVGQVPSGMVIGDIGPQTTQLFSQELKKCHTIIWNGPLGVFELPPFSAGTTAMAQVLASLKGGTTVVGGGSTAEAVEALGLADRMTHVSTGGGASLEFLEGKTLPGVEVLLNK